MQRQPVNSNLQVIRNSKHQAPGSDKIFHSKQYQLRKQSDTLRTQIFALMDEVCTYLQQNPNYKHLQAKLQHAKFFLSEKNTQELMDTIRQLEYSVRESVNEQQIDMDVANREIEVSQKELQNIRMHEAQMKAKHQESVGEIVSKGKEFQNMQQQLEGLTDEYNRKRQELLHAEMQQQSLKRNQLTNLSENWSKQTSYIREIINERAQTRNQVQRVTTVFEMLKQKLSQMVQIKQQYLRSKQQNQSLFQENLQLNQQIKQQQDQKHKLLEIKRNAVLSQEIQFAGLIAQDWSQTQQASRELLFEIINEINAKLPETKLKDVEEIIRSAENYFKNNSRYSGVGNDQVQELIEDDI